MATMTGNSHFLTAHQGDADDREENRDAKDKRSIHPRILQSYRFRNVRVTDNPTQQNTPSYVLPRDRDGFTIEAGPQHAYAMHAS